MRRFATLASLCRLHIVSIAALGCLTFGWVLTGHRPWLAAGLCALDWFLVNLLNRAVDVEEDRINRIEATALASRHGRLLTAAGLTILLGSLVAVDRFHPSLTPLRIAFHALGLAYNYPLLPGRRRIKQLYFWKNTASATGFLLSTIGYPLAASGGDRPGWALVAWTAAFFFPFELSYEVLYDLRDVEGDRAAGVRTYPVVHGERRAVRIVDGLIAASVATLVAGAAWRVVPWRLFVMVLGPIGQFALYKRFLARGLRAADCIALTWLGALLLGAYHLWIAAGLPGVDA